MTIPYNPDNPLHVALRLANEADVAYANVIRRLYGPKATRWTITTAQSRHCDVLAALRAKMDADVRFRDEFQKTYSLFK